MSKLDQPPKPKAENFLSLSPQDRREGFSEAIAQASSSMLDAAEIFAAMEASGDDVGFIPSGMRTALRRIAARQMLPNVWTELDGVCRQRVGVLPIEEQSAALDGKRYEVVTERGEKKALKVAEMTPGEVKRVFSTTGEIVETDLQMIGVTTNTSKKKKAKIIITTRHPRSQYGVPVIIIDGKLQQTFKGLINCLEEIDMTRSEFSERCGLTSQAVSQWGTSQKIPANALNVLRDLVEDRL